MADAAAAVGGIVGAGVGFLVGGPMGAEIGFSLGSALFATPQQVQGPRLGELRVTSSTQGNALPLVYGSQRIAGQMIWALPLEEVTTTSGGKGGGKQQSTTYSYYGTAAYALCQGPIKAIRRVWLNSQLVYDMSVPHGSAMPIDSSGMAALTGWIGADNARKFVENQIKSSAGLGYYMRVYTGTEDQMPDPRMEAEIGAGVTPALRGTAYVVFDRLPLDDYGNRLPNIEIEVVGAGGALSLVALACEFPRRNYGVLESAVARPQFHDGYLYGILPWSNPAYSQNFNCVDVWRWTPGSTDPEYIGPRIGTTPSGTTIVTTGELRSRSSGTPMAGLVIYSTPTAGGATTPWIQAFFPLENRGAQLDFPGGFVVSDDDTLATDGQDFALAAGAYSATASSRLIHLHTTPAGWQIFDPGTDVAYIGDLALDSTSIYAVCHLAGATSQIRVRKIDRATGSIVYSSPVLTGDGAQSMCLNSGSIYMAGAGLNPGASLADSGHGYIYKCNGTAAWARLAEFNGAEAGFVLFSAATRHVYGSFYCDGKIAFIDALNSSGASLRPGAVFVSLATILDGSTTVSAIVGDLCARSGLTAVDTSALTDVIDGYTVATRTSARAAIDPLRQYAFFDGAEVDGRVVFTKRGGASAATIPDDDLLHEAVDLTRAQELDLPREICIRFYDVDGDYQTGAQYARRMVSQANQTTDTSLPIAMTAARAVATAQAGLYEAWASRTTAKFSTTLAWAEIEPGDVVQVGGHRIRITLKNDNAGTLEFEGVLDDASAVIQTVNSVDTAYTQSSIAFLGATDLQLFDGPALTDATVGNLYASIHGSGSSWYGAAIFDSTDGVDFTKKASITGGSAAQGVLTAAMSTADPRVVDESTVVLVQMRGSKTLSGCNYSQLLRGTNTAIFGDELISYRDAALVGGTTLQPIYRLTGLLRGRRGSVVTAHAAGDRFVLLDNVTPLAYTAPDIGHEHQMKAISFGKSDAPTQTLTLADLGYKPNAVALLNAGHLADGSTVLQWTRSTRTDAAWRDNGGGSLDESAESYEIDVFSASGAFKRTLSCSTPTVTYAHADMVADGVAGVGFGATVYQLSDKVGRGRPASISVSGV